jgi:exosortase/archaeosortase family protein
MRKEFRDAGKFLGVFLIAFVPVYLIVNSLYFFNWIALYSSQFALSLFGKAFSVQGSELVSPNGLRVLVNDLCAAKLEIALLSALVLASFEKTLEYRLKGVVAGLLFILLFNPIRIAVSVMIYSPSNPVLFVVSHDVLFRASIIAFLATFYAVWHYWD